MPSLDDHYEKTDKPTVLSTPTSRTPSSTIQDDNTDESELYLFFIALIHKFYNSIVTDKTLFYWY